MLSLRGKYCFALLLAMVPGCRTLLAQAEREQPVSEQRIVELANSERAKAGLQPVQVDAKLVAAARAHAVRMAEEGAIAHRYGGEADLTSRAGAAGARFSLIEENIAFGPSPEEIHEGWMRSPGHHDNLLNPVINRIGVAVIAGRGGLYAVADYAQGVEAMTPAQVEAKVGAILVTHGVRLAAQAGDARRYCALAKGEQGAASGVRFMMRWQSAEIEKLPPEMSQALASGQYKLGAVGACAAQGDGGASGAGFTAYRVAVLLY